MCALLNCDANLDGFSQQVYSQLQVHGDIPLEERFYVETHPHPHKSPPPSSVRSSRLVDRILQAKAADPQADTTELEEEIDLLVYDLYGLTGEEVSTIADAF